MLNDAEVATDLKTISCSSQVLSSSDVPEVNSSNMSTTTEMQALNVSQVPEVESL